MVLNNFMGDKGFSQPLTLSHVNVHPLRTSGGISPSMALGIMPTRPALLISITDTQGCTGWGEVWANFPPRANIHKAHLIEDIVAPKLNGYSYIDPREANTFLRADLEVYFLHVGQDRVLEHILAGLDAALWDLSLRSAGQTFVEHLGLTSISPSYASSINPSDLDAKFQEHTGYGQSAFKLKLGFGDKEDVAFVREAYAKRPAEARLMVDSNQKWTPEQAKRMLERLAVFDLLFAEEPIPANASLATWECLAESSSIPLAAGENVYGKDAFIAMANAGVTYLQPDVAKWGGVSGALDLAANVPSCVKIWPHFMGTALGQMAALSVTGALGDGAVCEMDVNLNPLRTELCGGNLTVNHGMTCLTRDPGLVTPPIPAMLAKFTEAH